MKAPKQNLPLPGSESKHQRGLPALCQELPHLSGVAAKTRIHADPMIAFAGIGEDWVIRLNPTWFCGLSPEDARFVLAHELYHAALCQLTRCKGADSLLFNIAADYIINDMLQAELNRPAPKGVLDWVGARNHSAESLYRKLLKATQKGGRRGNPGVPSSFFDSWDFPNNRLQPGIPLAEDCFWGKSQTGQAWNPDERPDTSIPQTSGPPHPKGQRSGKNGEDPLVQPETLHAVTWEGMPTWHLALQSIMESCGCLGIPSYARSSRRKGDGELVLPGRLREDRVIHFVMPNNCFPKARIARFLGDLQSFCLHHDVGKIHFLQSHLTVETEGWFTPEDLNHFNAYGCGCNGLTKPWAVLSEDPTVKVVLVLTTGTIHFPNEPPSFEVLWVYRGTGDYGPAWPGVPSR